MGIGPLTHKSSTQQRETEAPEVLLAHTMKSKLGVDIDPSELCRFICENWHRVQTLAHKIHDTRTCNHG